MTFSKQLFSIFFLIFLFPLRHASKPKKCSSRWETLRCKLHEVPIQFPFCDHKDFDLSCNNLNKTVLNLPMSGTFLVRSIDYINQQISISDPENCLPKRLLTFNVSGSPFSSLFDIEYTFFTCPNDVVVPSSYRPVPCLSNSTFSFFATTDFKESRLRSCQIVKRLHVPASDPLEEMDFSNYVNNQSFLLKWHSPNCTICELDRLRCGFRNKASLKVRCFRDASGYLSNKAIVIIVWVSTIGGVIFFTICSSCIGSYIYRSESSVGPRQQIARSREILVTATKGLDQSTIESYKKMELGKSIRLPGTNGVVCSICLSDYASKETVRFIPECDHCFHVECIDKWLKIHGSCPLCRNLPA